MAGFKKRGVVLFHDMPSEEIQNFSDDIDESNKIEELNRRKLLDKLR